MSAWVLGCLMVGQVSVEGATLTVSSSTPTVATSSLAQAEEGSWTPRDLLDLFDFGLPGPEGKEVQPSPPEQEASSPRPPQLPPLWTAVLWALLLFGLGRWVRTWSLPSSVRRSLPLVELGLWTLWLGVFSSLAWSRGRYVWVAILWVSSLPPLLSVGRRVAAGLQFWLGSGLPEGAAVEVDGNPGTLRRVSAFELEVETEEGWLVRVPYSSVASRVRVRSQARAHRVSFEVRLHEHQDPKVARARMVELVLSSAWSRLEGPSVELMGEGRLRVDASVVEDEAKSLLVSDVKRAWADLRPPGPRSSSVPRGPSAASS
ncbi:MAG: hypothetical protein AAF851_17705 [Myxococcota bacterium]